MFRTDEKKHSPLTVELSTLKTEEHDAEKKQSKSKFRTQIDVVQSKVNEVIPSLELQTPGTIGFSTKREVTSDATKE